MVCSRRRRVVVVLLGMAVVCLCVVGVWFLGGDEWSREIHRLREKEQQNSSSDKRKLGGAFLINLDKRTDRLEGMKEEITKSKILRELGVKRIAAVDGTRLPHRDMVAKGILSKKAYNSLMENTEVNGEYLTMGGLGCFLSHVHVWEEIALMEKPALVLEDDVMLSDTFDDEMEGLLRDAPSHYGIIYLANMVGEAVHRSLRAHNDRMYRMKGDQWGTYAYVLSPPAARMMLKRLREGGGIAQQVDSFIIDSCYRAGIPTFMAKTNLVRTSNERGRDSDIQRYSPDRVLIPKRIHRIWLGGSTMGRREREYGRRWERLHPGWEMMLWHEGNLPEDLSLRGLIDSMNVTAMKSDALRYELLYRYGGIYLDVDVEPLKNVEPLLGGVELLLGYEDDDNLCNAIMGAVPGHPFLKRLVEGVTASTMDPTHVTPNARTGPEFLKREFIKHTTERSPDDITSRLRIKVVTSNLVNAKKKKNQNFFLSR